MTTAARGQKVRAPVLLEPPLEEVGLGTPRISTMLSCTIVSKIAERRAKTVQSWEAFSFLSSTKADLNKTYCRSQFRAQANSAQLVTADYLVSNTADTTILEAKLCTRIM